MPYDRDRLELVDEGDERAARALKRYMSKKLYGSNYELPRYVVPVFFAGCFGFVMMFFGVLFLITSITGSAAAASMLVVGTLMAAPQAIYWELTSVNESRLEKLIEDGRIRYHS